MQVTLQKHPEESLRITPGLLFSISVPVQLHADQTSSTTIMNRSNPNGPCRTLRILSTQSPTVAKIFKGIIHKLQQKLINELIFKEKRDSSKYVHE